MDDCLLLDPGSFRIKFGRLNDEEPSEIQTQVVRLRGDDGPIALEAPRVSKAGEQLVRQGRRVTVNYPVVEGQISDMDDFSFLLEHIVDEEIEHPFDVANSGVCVAEPIGYSQKTRECLAEILFETLQFKSVNFSLSGVLALIGTGRITGLVVDCGYELTQIVPVYESFVVPTAIACSKIAGHDTLTFLAKQLSMKDAKLVRTQDMPALHTILKTHCAFSLTKDSFEAPAAVPWQLPDGHVIQLDREINLVPETLYNPDLLGSESLGLGQLLLKSVRTCPLDISKPLLNNTIFAGGCACIKGAVPRLANELKALLPASASREVKVHSLENPDHLVWRGAQAFARINSGTSDCWVSKAEFRDAGYRAILDKCVKRYSFDGSYVQT